MKITKTKLSSLLQEGINEYYAKKGKRGKIAQLVKEELEIALDEDANDDTFEMVDAIVDEMGADKALDNLVQAMERSRVQALLLGILQDYGIPFGHGENALNEFDPRDNNKMRGKDPSKDRPKKDSKDNSWLPERKLKEETKPHEADRHPSDTPKDRIRLEEGNEAGKLIDALGKVGDAIEGTLGSMSDDPKDAEAVMQAMPETMKTLQAANEQIQQIWEAMHDMLQTNEETKPHEADRHPADTPEDRIRK